MGFDCNRYSGELVRHAGDVLDAVMPVISQYNAPLPPGNHVEAAVKVAGIHWWYASKTHAAEMTAGYYNYFSHCGYEPIVKCLKVESSSQRIDISCDLICLVAPVSTPSLNSPQL